MVPLAAARYAPAWPRACRSAICGPRGPKNRRAAKGVRSPDELNEIRAGLMKARSCYDGDMDELRAEMESYRRDAAKEADEMKDPFLCVRRLRTLYGRFDSDERVMADQVICGWALSEDEATRYDAMMLIEELNITRALPMLEELVCRFSASTAPGASWELTKAKRIIKRLTD
jgi:hypothetical protein